jgi:hypothetical protein
VANEYSTLAKLKARMKITDTADDVELQGKLTTASRDVDLDCGRPHGFWLDPAAVQRTFNPQYRIVPSWDGEKLLIDDIGDITGLVVEVGAGTNWVPVTDYDTGPDNALADGHAIEWLLRPYLPWVTWPRQRIRITAKWGWPAVPAQIEEATLMAAQRLFRRKDSPEGVLGNSDFGVVRVGRWDPDYDKLIRKFVKPGIG